jgi:tetratricopeptide (TPR) repeat protein
MLNITMLRHVLVALLLPALLPALGCRSASQGRMSTTAREATVRCDRQASARTPSVRGLAACQAAVREHPDSAELRDALAIEFAQQGRYDEALAAWQEFVRLRPNEFTGHQNVGLMLELRRRFAESLQAFERALALAPDLQSQQTTAWHIGVAHYNLGRPEQALGWFREAAALDSTDASAWSYAGIAAGRLGRHAEAVSYWERARQTDSQYLAKVPPAIRRMYDESLRIAGPQPPAPTARVGLVQPRQP